MIWRIWVNEDNKCLKPSGGAVNFAFLSAVFVSNLPEGVAGTVNLDAAGQSRQAIFRMWAMLVAVSAACTGIGYILVQ